MVIERARAHVAGGCAPVLALAVAAMVAFAPLAAAADGALRLLMVEQPGCAWCAAWDRDIAATYPLTEEGRAAPLERIDIGAVRGLGLALARPARYTPSFILLAGDAEIGRIEGYPGEDFFWGLLGQMLRAAPGP